MYYRLFLIINFWALSFSNFFSQQNITPKYGIIEDKKGTFSSINHFTKNNNKLYRFYESTNKKKNTFWIQELNSDYKILNELQLDIKVDLGRIINAQSDNNNLYVIIEQIKSEKRSFLLVTIDANSLKMIKKETLFTSNENASSALPILITKKSNHKTLFANKINNGTIKKDEIKVECLVLDNNNHKTWAKTIVMPYKKSTQCTIKDLAIGENGEVLITIKGKKEAHIHYYNSKGDFIAKKEITSNVDVMKNYTLNIRKNGFVVLAGLINNSPKNNELGYIIFDNKSLEIIKSKNVEYPMDKLLVNFTPKEQEQEIKRQKKGFTLLTNKIIVRDIVDTKKGIYIISELSYRTPIGEGTSYLKEIIINKLNETYDLSWTRLISKNLSGSVYIDAELDYLGHLVYDRIRPFGTSYSLMKNEDRISILFNDFKENKNIIHGELKVNDYKSGELCISICNIKSNGDIHKQILDRNTNSNLGDYLLMHNSVNTINNNTTIFRLNELLKKEKKFLILSH